MFWCLICIFFVCVSIVAQTRWCDNCWLTGGFVMFLLVPIVQNNWNNRHRTEPPVNWRLVFEVIPKYVLILVFKLSIYYSRWMHLETSSTASRFDKRIVLAAMLWDFFSHHVHLKQNYYYYINKILNPGYLSYARNSLNVKVWFVSIVCIEEHWDVMQCYVLCKLEFIICKSLKI